MFHFVSRFFRSPARKVARKPREARRVRLSLERLEDRAVPAALSLTVKALTDNGPANGMPDGVGAGNTGDLRYCINQADIAANAGSSITFQAGLSGTLTLSNVALPHISQNMSIGGPGADVISVQGTANAQNPYSIFVVNSGVTATIAGLTITGGYTDNMGAGGGGVLNDGDLTLVTDVIENNTASNGDPGGGISNGAGAQLSLQDDSIYLNDATAGGGIANWGTVTICCGSQIYSNSSTGSSGGGIYNGGSGTMELFDNTQIYGNTSATNGGGVYNLGTFTMHGGSIYSNDVGTGDFGGGVYSASGGNVTLDQGVSLTKNTAKEGAGLYLETQSTTTLNTVTIQGNILQLGGSGKGIYWQIDMLNPQNDAVLNQTAVNNPDLTVKGT